jgi:hypothetical protein
MRNELAKEASRPGSASIIREQFSLIDVSPPDWISDVMEGSVAVRSMVYGPAVGSFLVTKSKVDRVFKLHSHTSLRLFRRSGIGLEPMRRGELSAYRRRHESIGMLSFDFDLDCGKAKSGCAGIAGESIAQGHRFSI